MDLKSVRVFCSVADGAGSAELRRLSAWRSP